VRSTSTRLSPSTSQWSAYLGLIAVLCLFCAPLFVGLGDRELGSDEAIYSYAVDRIIDTGDWLTPRAIPYDGPFLEKPPLKFWIVAGAIRAGLLPHDEFGLRFIDALFSAVAFVYVFWLGRWLAGSVCGFVAVLVLFTINVLLFEHGLRSNNMDAALVLSYCGGVYHFARWVEDSAAKRRSRQALAVAGYFTLGFMTKFVAVLFLPLVCAVALAWPGNTWPRIRSNWRDWVVPALLVCAASVPWFVYQALQVGGDLWDVIVAHGFTRFTGALDPRHLQPWHYYYSQMWAELTRTGTQWIAAVGMIMLAVKGSTERPWLARLLFVWWMVPFALMSIGTSKLIHYAYPFLPAIALGVGAVADALMRAIASTMATTASVAERGGLRVMKGTWARRWPAVAGWFPTLTWTANEHPSSTRTFARGLLVAAAVFAVAVGVWTAVAEPIRWDVNGVELLSNSNTFRLVFIAAILLWLAGYTRILVSAVPITIMAALLTGGIGWSRNPILAYPLTIERLTNGRHPWRTLRDCAVTVRGGQPGTHVYPTYEQLLNHSPYYYLRHVGPWVEHDGSPKTDELELRLYARGEQSLIILATDEYQMFLQQIAQGQLASDGVPSGLVLSDNVVLLTPGPFAKCAVAAIAAGGQGVKDLPTRGTSQ
jgi:4-amino-4-deoxy-L-arabinose transferase-like glycosyltransferase